MINVVIPTFNRVESLETFFAQNKWTANSQTFNVTVLDNGSTDGTRDFIKNLSRSQNNLSYVGNEISVPAEENIKKAYAMQRTGRLWIIGDRYTICDKAIQIILDRSTAHPDAFLLLGLNSKTKSLKKDFIIESVNEIFSNDEYLRTASCLSTILYPLNYNLEQYGGLRYHDSPFPHTFVLLKALRDKIAPVIHVPSASVYSSSHDQNWAYSNYWIETGLKGWFKLVDAVTREEDLRAKRTLYKKFPLATSLGTTGGFIKRRLLRILGPNIVLRERSTLIAGLGHPRFALLALVSVIPIYPLAAVVKMITSTFGLRLLQQKKHPPG